MNDSSFGSENGLEAGSEETLAEVAVERLTADIVSGVLEPGTKLRIEVLRKNYGMGASPLREALARLCSEGLVTSTSHRGFRVAPMSKEDLEDITCVRQTIESTALRRAIRFGDHEWELGIVAAMARMKHFVEQHRVSGGRNLSMAEPVHKPLHAALIAACRSQRLVHLQELYYDQALRYRHILLEELHDRDAFLRSHQELVDVVLRRDSDDACDALCTHLAITPREVYPDAEGRRKRHEGARPAGSRKAARGPAASTGRRPR
ncbi:MAG TPA: GntR family transcriptional regulator [Polyangiaceae bacterium]|nr:GntR family transcriptional regulator [Polyangiaceae bacterium]